MSQIHWILQQNLIREQTFYEIKQALIAEGISFEEVKIIPFSDDLPEIRSFGEINVFYGSTTLVLNAYKRFGGGKGIFYESSHFNVRNYIEQWKGSMLNHDSRIMTLTEFCTENHPEYNRWFVRPIEDDKSFSGRIMTWTEIRNLEAQLKDSNNPYLTTETLVAISSPKEIEKEWRLFVVDKEIVSACRYTANGALNVDDADLPEGMLAFALERFNEYVPDDVFVMDIALHKGNYYIVECNCFNDSGFYRHDISKIIRSVNRFLSGNKQRV